jgi:hypothetical protein
VDQTGYEHPHVGPLDRGWPGAKILRGDIYASLCSLRLQTDTGGLSWILEEIRSGRALSFDSFGCTENRGIVECYDITSSSIKRKLGLLMWLVASYCG